MLVTALLFLETIVLLQKQETNPIWSNPKYPRKYVQYVLGWSVMGMVLFALAMFKGGLSLLMFLTETFSLILLNVIYFSLKSYATQDNDRLELDVLYSIGMLTAAALVFRSWWKDYQSKKQRLVELQQAFDEATR